MNSQICGVISKSGRFYEPLACAFEPEHDGVHSWSTLPTFGKTDVATQLADVEALMREHQDKQRFSQGYGSTADRTRAVLREYEDKATKALSDVKAFREDMLVYFRALVLTLHMTGEAATHAEKAARLRGAIELLEQAIDQLRKKDLEMLFSMWRVPDLFRSDWPTRRLMERIHDQERELNELRERVGARQRSFGAVVMSIPKVFARAIFYAWRFPQPPGVRKPRREASGPKNDQQDDQRSHGRRAP